MDRSIGKLAQVGILLSLVVLGGNAWVSYRNVQNLIGKERWIQHSQNVLLTLQSAVSSTNACVATVRGYYLLGDDERAAEYAISKVDVYSDLDEIARLTSDNPTQMEKLAKLRSHVQNAFATLDDGMAVRKQGPLSEAQQRDILGRGKMAILAIRQSANDLKLNEDRLLAERVENSRASFAKEILTFGVATAVAMGMVLFSYFLVRRDQKLRQIAARERNRLYNYNQLLVESTGEGIYGIDLSGRCTFLNLAGERILGLKSKDAIGKSMHELVHHHRTDGSVYPAGECPIFAVFHDGKGCRIDDEYFFRLDGTRFPVEYSAYPIRNEGAIEGAVVTFSDITERKRIEDQVRDSSERFRDLADNIAQLTWMADGTGSIFWYNQRWFDFTGTTPEEMHGWGWRKVHHPDHIDAVVEKFTRHVKSGENWEDTFPLRGKDGTYCWFLSRAVPIRDASGKIIRWFGTNTDITFQRETEEALREIQEHLRRAKEDADAARELAEAANVAKSQFLANMSHELRTPLNAVIMYSELLQEEAVDHGVESFIPDLDKIRAGGKHLLALVNGVLDLSKIEAGKMDLYLETFSVTTTVRDVATTVEPLVQKKSNRLQIDCPDDAGEMYGDLTKVRQILFNLLSNASKFTEHGDVKLIVRRDSMDGHDWITCRVIDTGIGMTGEQMDKLFRPFTQADASTTRKFGGTGLGLAISKRFCEMMGGSITVTSEPDKGSTFNVHLPARVERPIAAAIRSAPAKDSLSDASATVLVIDDEPSVRDLMSRSLASEGIRTVTASDGDDGLKKARELLPDLIFLDVLMPKMDGWAVLSALKADPTTADIPVVMLTIVNDEQMGYVLGASEYLTKPIERDRLLNLLKRYRPTAEHSMVMVVEDDHPTREVLLRTLTKEGWSVVEAENGKVALDRLRKFKPSLILLDIMMPEMDGFEFLESLRQKDEWKAIPVVVLTSKDLAADERARLTGKVERILQKGAYGRDSLLKEVQKIVALCAKRTHVAASALNQSDESANPQET